VTKFRCTQIGAPWVFWSCRKDSDKLEISKARTLRFFISLIFPFMLFHDVDIRL